MGPDDRFVLSKGHACLALYAVLEAQGRLPSDVMDSFCQPDSELLGHPERRPECGIHATTGSLGHGAPMAAGMALAKRIKKEPGTVFCLVGDGEMAEGSSLETLHLAAMLGLSNLVVIVDQNGTSPNKLDGEAFIADFAAKFTAFGWAVLKCDGHDCGSVERLLQPTSDTRPIVLIAATVKGKGVTYMEKDPQAWHHKRPLDPLLMGCTA